MSNLLKSMPYPADIILLPEDWLGPLVIEGQYYDDILCELQSGLPAGTLLVSGAQYARYNGETISTGAFICKDTFLYFDKIFPSRAIGERDFIRPGRRLPVVFWDKLGMASIICVDLFYPELTRQLASAGATIIFNPASIPASRIKLWQSLGIARAAENTIFVVMANNTGTCYPDGRVVSGGSFIAGPDGIFFHNFGSSPGVYYVEIDPCMVTHTRKRWGYLADILEFNRSPLTIPTEHYNIKLFSPQDE